VHVVTDALDASLSLFYFELLNIDASWRDYALYLLLAYAVIIAVELELKTAYINVKEAEAILITF
jgi:tRNA isopentenyl-2-thiomethyl-A-37 hydroxylase MiaE